MRRYECKHLTKAVEVSHPDLGDENTYFWLLPDGNLMDPETMGIVDTSRRKVPYDDRWERTGEEFYLVPE